MPRYHTEFNYIANAFYDTPYLYLFDFSSGATHYKPLIKN